VNIDLILDAHMNMILRFLGLGLVVGLGACAAVPQDPVDRAAFEANNDPVEPFNRTVFDINQSLDRTFIKPVAIAYRDNLPVAVQDSILNLGQNLREPTVFINGVLQARPEVAGSALARFVLNSTVGIGGLFDVASSAKIKRYETDFGQTLYIWGVKNDGPYLMMPLFGPTNARDLVGRGVDMVIDPLGLVTKGSMTRSVLTATDNKDFADGGSQEFQYASMGITILSVIDLRARYLDQYDALEQGSLDFYAKLRSVTRQRRDAALGKVRPGQQSAVDPAVLADPGP